MHYRFVRTLLLLLTVLLFCRDLCAQSTDQNYPVTAQAFIVSQPNQRLSSYFSSSTALTVNLLLKDLTKNSIQVYLRWSMEGPGVRVSSMDGYIPANLITLDRGMIRRFSGLDLQNDYFRQDLIEEQGLGGSPLRTNLPEGFYTFRVQALEAGTGREVSNIGETYFSITTPLPPIINIPFNGAELTMTEPQRVNIQWMPRHYRMPGNITTYDLKVCKVPDGYEPTEALDACVNPVIDDKGNPGTFYPGNTGIGNSLIGALEQGARYAARVTIHEFDQDGNEVVFVNEGRSEVTWFRYGKECISPSVFTIKEIGPGRVQLSWDALSGVESYKVLYRKTGDVKWSSQTVSAGTATVSDLTVGAYEFTVQSGCTDIIPESTQTFAFTGDDSLDDLPLALTDPMQLPVQASGCTAVIPGELADYYSNFPRVDGTVPSDTTAKLKLPGCALQSSSFSVCSPDHPMIPVPSGGSDLTSLKAGDVLGIYDFAVFVTESSGAATSVGGAFSGKGLVRLPFMAGTLALAEFSGVKAIKSGDGNGGCVYEAADFKLLNTSQAEVAAAKSKLLNELAQKTDPMAYAGTLAGALASYDALGTTATADSLCPYKTAILQASEEIRKALVEAGENSTDERIFAVLNDLKTLTDQLASGGSKVDSLTQKYETLISKIDQIIKDASNNGAGGGPAQPDYVIRNVQVSGIDNVSAKITWEMSGGAPSSVVTKYVIEYQDKDGGVLLETVTNPQVNLQRLREGMDYTFKILAYNGDKVVATSQGSFTTVKQTVPVPVNLAYTVLGNNSVRITWDKNVLHKDYKLVYKDDNGKEYYVYPTGNETIIKGLDPNKIYNYSITAYNDQRLSSDMALSDFNTSLGCDWFKINPPLTKSNGTTVYTTTGCENGKVIWTRRINGVDVSQVNGLYVYDSNDNLYSTVWAVCTIPGKEDCSDYAPKSGSVNTDCPGIAIEQKSISQDGLSTVLAASIPGYKIRWGSGEIAPEITVSLDKTAEYTAFLYNRYDQVCGSATYEIKKLDCDDFNMTVDRESIKRGQPVTLSAVGCLGQLSWSTKDQKSEITLYPQQTTTYFVDCLSGSSNCRKTKTITIIESACDLFTVSAVPAVINPGSFTTLSASNCSGVVSWGKGYENNARISISPSSTATYTATCTLGEKVCLSKPLSVAVNQVPIVVEKPFMIWSDSPVVDPVYSMAVIKTSGCKETAADYLQVRWEILKGNVWTKANLSYADGFKSFSAAGDTPPVTTYRAKCFDTQTQTEVRIAQIITLQAAPSCANFKVTVSSQTITKGNSATLSAVGCDGAVIWNKSIGVGENKIITPGASTTYSATCSSTNCQKSVVVNVNEAECAGFDVTAGITGCNGTVSWLNETTKAIGETSNPYSKDFKAPLSTTTYTATCSISSCKSSMVVEVAQVNYSFQAIATPSVIEKGKASKLDAFGCSGKITWDNSPAAPLYIGGDGKYYTEPLETTTYTARCTETNNVTSVAYATVVVGNPSCNFIASAVPSIISDDAECNITTLTASGCSGTVSWDNGAGTGIKVQVNPENSTAYTATCTSSSGTCQSTVAVVVTPCKDFKTAILANYSMQATGCPGLVSWNNGLAQGEVLNPPTQDPATYTAVCTTTGCKSAIFYAGPPNSHYCTPFVAKAQPELIYKNDKTDVLFKATGCEAGTVKWSNGKSGASFTESVKTSKDVTYKASCMVGGKEVATANATVKILTGGAGNIACKNFSAQGNPVDPALQSPYAPGTEIKLSYSGCPGKVSWSPSIPSSGIVTPYESAQYIATCYDGSVACKSVGVVITIDELSNPCLLYSTHDDENYLYGFYELTNKIGVNDKVCPGEVYWYKDESRRSSSLIAGPLTRSNPSFKSPQPFTQSQYFYYNCVMSNNISCQGDVYVTITNPSRQAASDQDVAKSVARTAASEASNCLPVLLQSYMAEYFQKMVCDYIPIYEKTKGATLTENDAKAFLTALQQAVSSNSIIKPFNPDFSKIDQQAVIAAILAGGDCKTAGELLAQAFGGTISVDDYDWKIRLTYRDVLDEIVGKLVNPPVEPLSLIATATDATCAADDGSISLKATGGVPPYQFSMDGTTFQESLSFTKLESGNYTLTVKDSKNATARATAIVKEPDTYLIETSSFAIPLRVGTTDPNARITDEGYVTAQFDENSRKATFKLKAGFDLKQLSSGVWKLTITSSDPADKKYEGTYRSYFNACNHSLFVGFYKEDYSGIPCKTDKRIDLQGKQYCIEGWLPESAYAEIVKNIMIFANGYRFYGKGTAGILLNSPKEYNNSNNIITTSSIADYWGADPVTDENKSSMDIKFSERRKPDVTYYADGHHSITTSNHNVAGDVTRSMSEKFIPGILGSLLAQQNMLVSPFLEQLSYLVGHFASIGEVLTPLEENALSKALLSFNETHPHINCSENPDCVALDTQPNDAGFEIRYKNGELAATDLIARMISIKRPANAKVTYNIDIVAHSMGFAYAQGMIAALANSSLKDKITWSSYYIIAPENGCSATYGKVDPVQWKDQLWQYGSNRGQGQPDPVWDQDGVAPQCPVTGLTDQSRAFIPATYGNGEKIPKGYLDSHSISNYGWIFEIPNEKDAKGYVQSR